LLDLPDYVQDSLLKGEVSEGQARPLIPHISAPFFKSLWEKLCDKKWTARQVENHLRALTKKIKSSPDLSRYHKVEEHLSERLCSKVKIKKSKKGGQLIFFFKSEAEYAQLVEKLSR